MRKIKANVRMSKRTKEIRKKSESESERFKNESER